MLLIGFLTDSLGKTSYLRQPTPAQLATASHRDGVAQQSIRKAVAAAQREGKY
jgi:hypothetical protein